MQERQSFCERVRNTHYNSVDRVHSILARHPYLNTGSMLLAGTINGLYSISQFSRNVGYYQQINQIIGAVTIGASAAALTFASIVYLGECCRTVPRER